jgi:hypothetical protein
MPLFQRHLALLFTLPNANLLLQTDPITLSTTYSKIRHVKKFGTKIDDVSTPPAENPNEGVLQVDVV